MVYYWRGLVVGVLHSLHPVVIQVEHAALGGACAAFVRPSKVVFVFRRTIVLTACLYG